MSYPPDGRPRRLGRKRSCRSWKHRHNNGPRRRLDHEVSVGPIWVVVQTHLLTVGVKDTQDAVEARTWGDAGNNLITLIQIHLVQIYIVRRRKGSHRTCFVLGTEGQKCGGSQGVAAQQGPVLEQLQGREYPFR